jgi:hypothetical protein
MSNHNQNGKSVVVRIVPTTTTISTATTTTTSDNHNLNHHRDLEPSETSPLNQPQHARDNHSDASSSAVSTVTSEQSTKKLIDNENDQSWCIIRNILANLLIFLCGMLSHSFTL